MVALIAGIIWFGLWLLISTLFPIKGKVSFRKESEAEESIKRMEQIQMHEWYMRQNKRDE